MPRKLIPENFLNKQYGHIFVSGVFHNTQDGNRLWFECICDCGMTFQAWSRKIYTGTKKSCGCKTLCLRKATCTDKYGVDNVSKSIKIQNKKTETLMRNWGVQNVMHSPILRDKIAETNLKRYGGHPMTTRDIQDKVSSKTNIRYTIKHWKTSEILTCVSTYEVTACRFLNLQKINFEWQPGPFRVLQSSASYRPDVYLIDSNEYIEIKGYWREDSLLKYEDFAKTNKIQVWDKLIIMELRRNHDLHPF